MVDTRSVSGSDEVDESLGGLSCDDIYNAQVSVCTSFNCIDSETISEFFICRLWYYYWHFNNSDPLLVPLMHVADHVASAPDA